MAGKFQPPPLQGQKLIAEDGTATQPLRQWLDLIPPALTSPANSGSVPANSGSQGIAGQLAISADGTKLLVCVGDNHWKQILLTDIP